MPTIGHYPVVIALPAQLFSDIANLSQLTGSG
jgi:hypothetical protein